MYCWGSTGEFFILYGSRDPVDFGNCCMRGSNMPFASSASPVFLLKEINPIETKCNSCCKMKSILFLALNVKVAL